MGRGRCFHVDLVSDSDKGYADQEQNDNHKEDSNNGANIFGLLSSMIKICGRSVLRGSDMYIQVGICQVVLIVKIKNVIGNENEVLGPLQIKFVGCLRLRRWRQVRLFMIWFCKGRKERKLFVRRAGLWISTCQPDMKVTSLTKIHLAAK